MKVNISDNNFTFNAGLTKRMQAEISACKTKKIENYFADRGIEADFKDNKVVAWCSLKCIRILEMLNKNFGLNLGFPNGIYVEDFQKLNGIDTDSMGFTNFAPTYLYKSCNIVVPEKTIFFNEQDVNWDELDTIADKTYENGISTTDFFLENILHEFMHVLHENNMIKKLGGINLVKMLQKIQEEEIVNEFFRKHAKPLSEICHYAASNPLEAVACDLSKREVASLDKETLIPKTNIFNKKPYNKRLFLVGQKETHNEKLLRNYWNGNLIA